MSDAPARSDAVALSDLIEAGLGGDDLEAMTRPLLKLLHEATGLESTYLTRIDLAEDVQRIVYARNVGDMEIPEGLTVPWSDTLCKRALESGQVCTTDVPGVWGDSDAARALGIQTYVSSPITLPDGSIVGTLCGASSSSIGVDERTAALLRLFSRLLADQLERDRVLKLATERAAEAERSLRERVEFVASSTHALKGPLAIVRGWLGTLDHVENPDAALLHEAKAAMLRGVQQLNSRIDQLLQEAHATTVGQQLTIRPVDLVELVAGFAADLRSPDHDFPTDTTDARALADPTGLTIILEHFVENAMKYSPGGTTVTLRCGPTDDGQVYVEVSDQGVGVPENIDVFQPFARADADAEGVGLGLHIVRSLAEAMGGTASARRNTDVGSTFRVVLPTAD